MPDKDNDGIDDKVERIIDYVLAAIMLLVAIPAFFMHMITFAELKIVLYLVTGLSGGLTMLKGIIEKLFKK